MKNSLWSVPVFLLFSLSAPAQVARVARVEEAPRISEPRVVERGAHHRVWERTITEKLPDGRTIERKSSFTELANGLHKLKDEQWEESREEIEVFPGGAIARSTAHQVIWSPNINSAGAIDLLTPDGKRFRSHIIGLAYMDAATGRSEMIAEIKDSIGELVGSNQVIYRDAFTDFRADVRYTLTRAGFEQDIVLRENPPSPREYAMNPATTRLEVWTEFIEAPEPVRGTSLLKQEGDLEVRRGMVDPDLTDERLEFGEMTMGPGRAFPTENESDEFSESSSTPVGKNWIRINGRQFLIEKVDYRDVLPQLDRLPKSAAITPVQRNQMQASRRGENRSSLLAAAKVPAPALPATTNPMRLAQVAAKERGFVLDYTLSGSLTNFTFRGGTTYYISGNVTLSGTTIIEGGVIVKYTNTIVAIQGPVDCRADVYRPSFFMSKNDDTYGEIIPGSTGNPLTNYYGSRCLDFTGNTNAIDLHNLRFRHSFYAIYLNTGCDVTVRHSQFYRCFAGIVSYGGSKARLRNALIHDGEYAIGGTSLTNIQGEHLTAHRLKYLISSSSAYLTNSIVLAVTNLVKYTGANVLSNSVDTGYFQTLAGGARYLVDNSTNRNAGTTNINAGLLADLKRMTTEPPKTLYDYFYVNTNLSPVIVGDTVSGDLPDLGYHYSIIDYLASGAVIDTGVTVVATNGVNIAVDYSQNNFGFALVESALISQGSPFATNRIFRAHMVQETSTGNPGTRMMFYDTEGGFSQTAQARLRFTELIQLPSDGYILFTGTGFSALELSHSSIYGPSFVVDISGSSPLVCGATNSFWEGGGVQFGVGNYGTNTTVHLRNNLFRYTGIALVGGTNTWTVRDNLFDSVSTNIYDFGSPVQNSFNAYYQSTNVNFSGGTNNLFLSSLAYETGPLSRYYLPTNSPLINAGSTSASSVGLYHFTTTTNQVKEGTSTNDIGLHFVALNGSNQPVDSDSDGIADYIEDVSGNGIADGNENSAINPVLTLMSPMTYIKGGPAKRFDTNAIAYDSDAVNFNGGQFTVRIASGGEANDKLGIRHEGTGNGQLGATTNTISYGGTNIATYTGGSGTNALVISFNTNAVNTSVQALARNLTFQSISNAPASSNRNVSFTLTDGKGGTNAPTSVAIQFVCPDAIDAFVVIDISQSLSASEFLQAKEAASNFVNHLNFTTDRIGLVSFAGYANFDSPLTTNGALVQNKILGLTDTNGTRFQPPLDMVRTNMATTNSNVLQLLVFISDGRSGGPGDFYTNRVLATNAALAVKDAGIRLIAVAYGNETGTNGGTNLMKWFASSLNDFYHAPSITDLNTNFAALAEGICRGNIAPTATITSPTNGAFFPGLSVKIVASASDADGSVTNLAVFHGATNIGSGTGTNLTFTWTPPGGGNYAIYAKATDNAGATGTSPAISFNVNGGPAVNAGTDLQLMLIGTNSVFTNLTGTVTDADNLPAGRTLSIAWSGISGPGPILLVKDPADPNEPRKAKVTFTKPGIYTLRLTASDSLLSASDDITITVNKTNVAPQVYPGPNQTVTFPAAVYLPGAVSDDGAPVGGALTTKWTGPDGVQFASDTATNTFARFSAPGAYQLSLAASDGVVASGGLSTTQSVTITVVLPEEQTVYRNADFVSGGIGGVRGMNGLDPNPKPGSGSIKISGIVTNVRQAFLYWAGPVDSGNPDVNARVLVNGRLVEGVNLGVRNGTFTASHSDNWSYEKGDHPFPFAFSYKADITALVRAHGNGLYVVTNLVKGREVEVNGASIIVVQDDPSSTNQHDLILWNGNDSNDTVAYHPRLGDAIYSIARSASQVFIGGGFFSEIVTNRNHFAVLNDHGGLDTSFTQSIGVAVDNSTVFAVLPLSDGSVVIGGEFTAIEGESRNRIARFLSNGTLATNFNLNINGSVRGLALDQNGKILIGGQFTSIDSQPANKVARLLANGQVDTNFSAPTIDLSVLAVASDRNTNVIIGGDFQLIGSANRHGLARLSTSGSLLGSSDPNVTYGVRAILPVATGKIFIGGDFSTVGVTSKSGIARLNEDLTLDSGFTNSVTGTIAFTNNSELVYLGSPSVYSITLVDTNRILIGGRFVKVNGAVQHRVAIVSQSDGSLAGSQPSIMIDPVFFVSGGSLYDGTVVYSTAVQPDGKFLVAGNYRTIMEGLPVEGSFRMMPDGTFDSSYRVIDSGSLIAFSDVNHVSGNDVSIELHASDGQAFADPFHRADPPWLLNGLPWMDNQSVSNCSIYNDVQIFGGYSVPAAHWDCALSMGLWDITNSVVPSSLLASGTQTLLLTSPECPTAYFGGCGGSDLITLVAAVLRMPSNTNLTNQVVVHVPEYLPPVAWADTFAVSRSTGRHVLNVLSNDVCPSGGLLKISSVSLPAHGKLEIVYEKSAVLYSVDSGYSGSDTFSYSIVDDNGNTATASVSVEITGNLDSALIKIGERKTGSLAATDYPSPVRGSGQYADYYRFDAVRGDHVGIVISNVSFGTHVYVMDPRGVVVASGSFEETGWWPWSTTIEQLPILETGTHFIEVTSHDTGVTGDYDLHLFQDYPFLQAYLPDVLIHGVPLTTTTPYFLGVARQSEPFTNTVIIRNSGRKSIGSLSFSVSQNSSTASITPTSVDALPVGRSSWLNMIITPGSSVLGLKTENVGLWDGSAAPNYPVQFFVNASSVSLPDVTVTSPSDGTVLRDPDAISIQALVTNYSGSIPKVEFYADGAVGRFKLGEATSSPYGTTWFRPPPGSYRLFAVASNYVGSSDVRMSVSPGIRITVGNAAYNSKPICVADIIAVGLNTRTNFLNVLANDVDADGDNLRIIALEGPTQGVMAISSDGKGILYTPPSDTFGEESFGYTVDDGRNGRSRAVVTVKIGAANATITYPTPSTSLSVGNVVGIAVDAATSQGSILNVEVFTNGVKVGTVATNPYVVNWKPMASGFYTLKAVANDSSGNRVESPLVTVGVGSPGSAPPIAAIANIRDGDLLRNGVFNLLGTADSTNSGETVSYQLKLSKQTTNGIVAVADFTPTPVDGNGFYVGRVSAGGLLAALDFTGIRNGVYSLSLAVRAGGKERRTEVSFALESNAKLGLLTFSEEDLVVPLGGVPISIIRTYNSLKTDLGDFGTSWTYSINDLEIEIDEQRGIVTDEDDEDFSMRLGGGRNITLTLPGGQRTTFLYSLNPGPSDDGVPCFCYEAKWEAAPGVYAQLAPLDNNRLQFIPWQSVIPPYWLNAEDTPFDSYDFSGFVLTNSDGTEYILKGDDLGDHLLPPEGSQLRSVRAYSTPRLRLIRTRSGDEISVTNFTQSGTNYLRVAQYNPLQQPAITTNSILLVRNGGGLIERAYGPESLNTDGTLKAGAIASVRYSYSNSFLVAVERLVKSSPLTYETNRYEYTNSTHPHFITGIIDARGVRVATTGKDAQGRLTSLKAAGQSQGTRFIHDAANLREIAIDPFGYQTVHEFDRRGNVLRTIDALGQMTSRDYDDAGNQLSETDALGNTQRFGYDSFGNRTSTIDALGSTNRATFGLRHQLLTTVDALGHGVTNVYDSADNLLFTTNALGYITRQLYDSRGLLTASIDSLNNVTTNRYDANGRLTNTATLSAQSSILSSNAYAYDDRGNRTNETSWVTIDGTLQTITTSYEFDMRNRMVRSLDALGYTNTTTYNALGKTESMTDKMGRVTRYWYDARGNLIQTAYPSNLNTAAAVTRTVYDELNRPVYTQWRTVANDPPDSGNTIANATYTIYDPLGREERTELLASVSIGWVTNNGAPATVLNSVGQLLSDTSTEFDGARRVASQTDARGVTTFFDYDANGRRTATTVYDDESRAMSTRTIYDAAGNAEVALDALGHGATNVFDALNRSVELQLPDGTKRFTIYDELGRRVAEVDQAGVTNRFGFDGLGRLTASTNAWATANATWATYRFDELGRQTNQVDALGRVTRFVFDKLGRRTARTLPGGQSEGFAYNAAGNPMWHTNFNSQAIRMDYDAASRLLARVYPDGTSNTFTYTITGQRWKMSDASGVTTNKLDNRDRVTQRDHYEAGSIQSRLIYSYDARGNVAGVQGFSAYQNGGDITYAYDSLNRLEAVSDARSGPGYPEFTTGYTYDLVGNLESCQTTNRVRHQYRYNALNRLTNLVVLAGSVTLAQFDYALGVTGQRDKVVEHVNSAWRTNDWKYDRQYRLTNELLTAASGTVTGRLAYAYDIVANRTNRSSTLSQLTSTNSAYNTNDWLTADVYDSAGNTRTNAAGVIYRYNADNQLTNVVNGSMTIAMIYNADGHRIRKSVTVGGNTTNTYYLIDEKTPTGYAQVLEEWVEVVGVSSTRTFYTYGLDLISQRVYGGATNYFGYDGHGSVRFLTGSGTNVTDTYTFDAYGTLIARTGTTPNHYLYAGEQFDEDLGQYYLRARYMNPEAGRFLTMDSFEGNSDDPLSLHKYLYAHANPVNGIDPTGHLTLTELNTTVGNVLNLATKGFNAISRAKRAVNFVNAISDLITQIESGAIVELIRSEIVQAVQSWSTAGTETANLAKPEFWSAAGKALSREATSVARTVISEWAQTILNKYSRQSTAPFHWVLYMPTPADAGIPNPKIWLNVPKMEIGKAPVVLKFGHGDQRGRLFGMGLRDDNTHADIQFFRMDYHRPHKTFRSTWERRDAYYDAIEQDGFEFNFHVPRN